MSKITTENCKEFLINHFNSQGINTNTNDKDWKRTSKYKKDDLWIREFSHSTLGIISLMEKSDVLEIVETKIQEKNTEVSYFKKFSNEEVDGAKKLVKKLIKIRTNGNDDDLLFESEAWEKYSHALPSQFTFYFPFDAPYEVYHNDLANVSNGLDSPFVFNNNDSFNIMFNDRNTKDIDLYTNDCLNKNISGVLS